MGDWTVDSGPVYPYGKAQIRGRIKEYAEDFDVTERLGFELSGHGEHLFLYVQKNGLTTHQLIDALSETVGIRARDIGYSGLKDKNAVTRQWISLHLPGKREIPSIPDTESYQVVDSRWHDRKLRVGSHASNLFKVVIREVSGEYPAAGRAIDSIRRHGFANYFGAQRFGSQGDNVNRALHLLNPGKQHRRLSRNRKSLMISALRSDLYNRILRSRIEAGIWQQPVDGDVFLLAGSRSFFHEPLTEEICRRYLEHDLHCGISLFGSGQGPMSARALQLEQLAESSSREICDTLLRHDVKRSLRANRAVATGLKVDFQPGRQRIEVNVELEKGAYLTTLINHFVDISDCE